MRLTLPLLARPKTATLSPLSKPETLDSYLSTLNATQLRSLARETGIPNSGRKDELRQRLKDEFVTSVFLNDGASQQTRPRKKKEGNGLSVLSIDMGIQNLAFAHLIVRPPETVLETRDADKKRKGLVTLNAWHRIGVQELGAASPAPVPVTRDADTEVQLKSLLPPSAFRTFTSTTKKQALGDLDAIGEELQTMKTAAGANKNFEPDTLSHNAFVLLSSLLQVYKPTHILIERQRFRSGGQSAVLEWSLRVGVFEGMLHAVLRTMRELARVNKSDFCEADDFQVYPISPARIMQFWDESKSSIEGDDGGEKEKGQNQRGVKQQKMDIVGHLLSASSTSDPGRRSLSCWDVDINTTDTDEQDVSTVVDAYLRRWNPQLLKTIPSSTTPKTGRKSKSDVNTKAYKIEKMDDLADCLLQGLTWLEWQARRARIVRGDRPAEA